MSRNMESFNRDSSTESQTEETYNMMEVFPREVWVHILERVREEDLLPLVEVSKGFAELVCRDPRVWKNLIIPIPRLLANQKFLLKKLVMFKNLESLELFGKLDSGEVIPEDVFILLSSSCSRLKNLVIRDSILDQTYVRHLATGCPQLMYLVVSKCIMYGDIDIDIFRNLRLFNMLDCSFPIPQQ